MAKQTIEKEQINGNMGSVPGWLLSGLVLVHENGYKFPTVDLQILYNVKRQHICHRVYNRVYNICNHKLTSAHVHVDNQK